MENTEREDFINIISSLKLDLNDFDFTETDSTNHKSNTIYAISGEIEITYKPSQISKKYKTGHMSSWLADFEFDIRTNFYRTRQ